MASSTAPGLRRPVLAAPGQEVLPEHQPAVVVAAADAARLDVDDRLQVRRPVGDLERLVDLLLVLAEQHLGGGVGQQVHDLGGAGWSGRCRRWPRRWPPRRGRRSATPCGSPTGSRRGRRARPRGPAARGRRPGSRPSTPPSWSPATARSPCSRRATSVGVAAARSRIRVTTVVVAVGRVSVRVSVAVMTRSLLRVCGCRGLCCRRPCCPCCAGLRWRGPRRGRP